ncbi:hypothetical protein EUA75_00600 [TM7 phylum sp. oral taxon 353]|nr:hypothetical protein EUA75_00600 [TM7 phylum sp. oral taxon 353]
MEKTIELIIIIMLLAIMAEIYLLVKPRRHVGSGTQMPILVDTSVLMDGRVVDLAKTGFLLGQIIVPRSVLIELQLLADGADHAKRERARFGMDAMKELKDVLGGSFTLLDDAVRIPEGVDNRLLQLAKEMNAAILTLDYNLNKVAQVEGIQILNINELAKSLRMSYLPGDELVLELTQKGQDSHQAVGYLHDGTMVVVEQAKKFIGQEKRVEIVRSLQTDAGKMMFAKLVVEPKTASCTKASNNSYSAVSSAAAAKSRSTGRRPQQSQLRKTTKANSSTVKKRSSAKSKTPAQHEADLVDLANSQ